MGQGSINQFQAPKAPIEGIAAALDAVQKYYGINTEKQKQKLFEAQMPAEIAKAGVSETEANLEKGFLNKFIKSQAPAQPSASNQVDPNAIVPQANAVNTAPPSQAPSRSMGMLDFINQEKASGGYVPPKYIALANDIQGLENKQLEGKKLGVEVGGLPAEYKRKEQEQVSTLQEKFNSREDVKEANSKIAGFNTILSNLKSGNPIALNIAKADIPIVATGIKRMSESAEAIPETKAAWDSVLNGLYGKATGQLNPKEVKEISRGIELQKTNALGQLDSAAESASSQVGKALGRNKDDVRNNVLLPGFQYSSNAIKFANKRSLPIDAAVEQMKRWKVQ